MMANKNLPSWYHTDHDWAKLLQYDFEHYMGACHAQIEAEWFEEEIPEFETVSGEPFCGCQDCETREILMFLVPRIIQGYKDGKLKLED